MFVVFEEQVRVTGILYLDIFILGVCNISIVSFILSTLSIRTITVLG